MEASQGSSAKDIRSQAALVFLISLAAGIYQVYFVHSPLESVYADMRGYIERAWDLIGAPSVVPYERFYPPGTHYVFALVFALFGYSSGFSVITALQICLLAAANTFSYLIAYLLFSSKRAALVLAVILSVYIPRTALLSFFVSEPLFLFFVTAAQWILLRAMTERPRRILFYVSGIIFGLAVITKGQGLAFVAGALALWLMPRFKHLRNYCPIFILGVLIPFAAVSAINSVIAGKPMFSIAANDMFNSYLGQSQRRGIGCFEQANNTFYFFHNNNSHFNKLLSAPMAIRASVLDREYFRRATLKLWSDQPQIQTVRSLHNIRELFLPELYWPLRDLQEQKSIARWSTLIWYWTFIPLGVLGTVFAVRRRRWLWQLCFAVVPVIGVSAMAFVSMGQPRYLIPFHLQLMLLSMPALCALERIGRFRPGESR